MNPSTGSGNSGLLKPIRISVLDLMVLIFVLLRGFAHIRGWVHRSFLRSAPVIFGNE